MQRDESSAKRPSPEGKRLGGPRGVVEAHTIVVLRQPNFRARKRIGMCFKGFSGGSR